jgi:hypothetical protein
MDEDILNLNLFTPDAIQTIATDLDLPPEFQLNAEIQEDRPRKKRKTGQKKCSRCGELGHQARSGKCREVDVIQFQPGRMDTPQTAVTAENTAEVENYDPIEDSNLSDDEQAPPDDLDFMGVPVTLEEDDVEQYIPNAETENVVMIPEATWVNIPLSAVPKVTVRNTRGTDGAFDPYTAFPPYTGSKKPSRAEPILKRQVRHITGRRCIRSTSKSSFATKLLFMLINQIILLGEAL